MAFIDHQDETLINQLRTKRPEMLDIMEQWGIRLQRVTNSQLLETRAFEIPISREIIFFLRDGLYLVDGVVSLMEDGLAYQLIQLNPTQLVDSYLSYDSLVASIKLNTVYRLHDIKFNDPDIMHNKRLILYILSTKIFTMQKKRQKKESYP